MNRISEVQVNAVLAALRSRVDETSSRRLGDGRLVADIVPRNPHRWSLSYFLSHEMHLSQSTVSARLAVLVKEHFIEQGSLRGTRKRWVVMEGDFRYSDSTS